MHHHFIYRLSYFLFPFEKGIFDIFKANQLQKMLSRLLHGNVFMQYHHKLMPFAWSVFIDASILAALYSHKPYVFPAHVIGAVLTGTITIITSFSNFLNGIPPPGNPMRTHKLTGTLLYLLIIVQIIIGILWWIIRSSQKYSQWSIRLKKMHKIVGYTVAIIAKLQVLYILPSQSMLFWFNLLWNLTTIISLIKAKRSKVKCGSNPELILKNVTYRIIKNVNDISIEYPNVFMYGNYVYTCEMMKNRHPAGYQVILESKGQSVDRYLYGMVGSQTTPSIRSHSHSLKSLAYLGKPIAKIHVSQQFLNFSQQRNGVRIHSVETVCTKSGLYALKLKVLQNEALQYQGYSQLEQLGRYYSLTLDNKTTRLYTTVNFLIHQNINFLMKIFPETTLPNKSSIQFEEHSSLEEVGNENINSKETMIPLLIKKYNNGRFTKKLFQSQAKSLILSCSKGRGLDLRNVGGGKMIFVAGGTGLLPFCDLIDLLFKQELIRRQPEFKNEVLEKNKILRSGFLERNIFLFYIAVNYLSEIHPIILNQLNYLSENTDKFSIRLKVKDELLNIPRIKQQNTPFQILVEEQLRNEEIAKIIVCGPSKLNGSMTKLFKRNSFQSFLIL